MNRRDFVLALTSTAFASPIHFISHTTAKAAPPKIIDAHCHIFNAADLPVDGFIEKVIIAQNKKIIQLNGDLKRALIFYIRQIADWAYSKSPKASDEIALLAPRDFSPQTPSQIRQREKDLTTELMTLLQSIAKNPTRAARKNLRGIGNYAPVAIMGLIHQEAFPQRYYAPMSGFNDGRPPLGSVAENFFDLSYNDWERPETIANELYDKDGITPAYLRWGLHFTRHRHELVAALSQVHSDNAILATPALIDYTHWLSDKHNVDLDNQTAVMASVSRFAAKQPSGLHIHGYAPFDPLRQSLYYNGKEASSSFERVVNAVTNQGFIGVKVYPPMGFQAINNKSIADGDFFSQSRRKKLGIKNIGQNLDRALRELYSWCQQNEVPILAHAAHSNGTSEEAMDRAAPEYWKLVLDEFPNLRLCLAHFGDFEQGLIKNAKLSATWEYQIAALMKSKPASKLYADISYLHTSLIVPGQKDGPRKEAQRMFATTLLEFGDDVRRRLIYGSDWLMLGAESNFESVGGDGKYNKKVRDFLSQMAIAKSKRSRTKEPTFTSDQIDQIFSINARNFLGLGVDQRAKGTRGRLEAFYTTNNLNASWLSNFD